VGGEGGVCVCVCVFSGYLLASTATINVLRLVLPACQRRHYHVLSLTEGLCVSNMTRASFCFCFCFVSSSFLPFFLSSFRCARTCANPMMRQRVGVRSRRSKPGRDGGANDEARIWYSSFGVARCCVCVCVCVCVCRLYTAGY
jgi:hypothetical protein